VPFDEEHVAGAALLTAALLGAPDAVVAATAMATAHSASSTDAAANDLRGWNMSASLAFGHD
jgi:hypothetical protein